MMTVTIDDETQARLRAVAAPGESLDALIRAAVQEYVARREREAAHRKAARAEMRAVSNGEAIQR